jgi:STE24 endopeptidase
MEPEHIFWGVLGFSWIEFIWEAYLSYRQRKIYKKHTTIPDELTDILDSDTFTKARLYALDKSNFGAFQGIFTQILSTILMLLFAFKYLWNVSGEIFTVSPPTKKSNVLISVQMLKNWNHFLTF